MNILPLSTLVPLKKYFVKDRAGKPILITSLDLSSNAEFDDLQDDGRKYGDNLKLSELQKKYDCGTIGGL